MKSVLFTVLFASSMAMAQSRTLICSNDNVETKKQTIFVVSGSNLGAICQRSLETGSLGQTNKKQSNEEICAKDMFFASESGTGMGKLSIKAQSTSSGIGFAIEISDKQKPVVGTVDVGAAYKADTITGGNVITIEKGKMSVTCK